MSRRRRSLSRSERRAKRDRRLRPRLHLLRLGGDGRAGVAFAVARGEIFGFLGPSGAGKSTTQKVLVGLLEGYRGRVSVRGKEVRTWTADDYEVQGFALAKAVGIVMVPCIVSYFVGAPWQDAFGLVPHYWPLKVFWLLEAGAVGPALAHALVGLAWQAVLLALLARRFSDVVRR